MEHVICFYLCLPINLYINPTWAPIETTTPFDLKLCLWNIYLFSL